MAIFGMLRVRNEERWIGRVIASILPCCDHVFVMDDKSTDRTVEICRSFSAVTVLESPFEGVNEARDKDWLLEYILRRGFVCEQQGDWVLAIDGDEQLSKAGPQQIKELCAHNGAPYCYSLKIVYLWDREDQWRVDGVYGKFNRPSLFKLINPSFRYKTTPWGNGANLHCSSTPTDFIGQSTVTDVALLHYGYLHREDRLNKHAYYNAIDPRNVGEDEYRHCVQGDVPEVPADARLKWAGPLTLVPWVE
jgi:glycosyltransferase involved in cell wall biosynthesis